MARHLELLWKKSTGDWAVQRLNRSHVDLFTHGSKPPGRAACIVVQPWQDADSTGVLQPVLDCPGTSKKEGVVGLKHEVHPVPGK